MARRLLLTVTAVLLLVPVQPTSGQFLRLPVLRNLFGTPGGNPDSDVTDGRAQVQEDHLPEVVPQTQMAMSSRSGLAVPSNPMSNLYFYPNRQPFTYGGYGLYPIGMPVRLSPPGMPHNLQGQPRSLEVRERLPEVPADTRSSKRYKETDDMTGEDRMIEALTLFKKLRTMVTE